jgi:hypothetical protein
MFSTLIFSWGDVSAKSNENKNASKSQSESTEALLALWSAVVRSELGRALKE